MSCVSYLGLLNDDMFVKIIIGVFYIVGVSVSVCSVVMSVNVVYVCVLI